MAKSRNAGALAAVGLLVVTMLVVGGRPAGATFPGPNGKIAYVVDDGMYPAGIDSEIYTIKPGGGKPFQLTHNDSEDGGPDYSPNGKRIAYSAFDGNDSEIYTIKATGESPSKSPTTIRTTKPLPTRPTARR